MMFVERGHEPEVVNAVDIVVKSRAEVVGDAPNEPRERHHERVEARKHPEQVMHDEIWQQERVGVHVARRSPRPNRDSRSGAPSVVAVESQGVPLRDRS